MRYLDLFAGIGGFALGLQQAYEASNTQLGQEGRDEGALPRHNLPDAVSEPDLGQSPTCIGYSEIDKYAIQIYEKHFPEHTNFGDITRINATELPDFDLVVGGFPCQAFSIAGKRGGFDDTRGTLFFDIARIAEAKRPMFLLLENVKGLISHDGGKTLEVILETLQELGYYVNYEIHNSKDFGVPQNRERIFFLCTHIRGLTSVGQNERMTFSERIIQEWLFQVLLNNLGEAQKLPEAVSKDWGLGYLICREISQNPEFNAENILDGITMDTAGKSSLFKGEPWQNIDTWLSKELGVSLQEPNVSIILTAINEIIERKTYTYSQMFQAILSATVLLRGSSKNLWSEILSSLILFKEDTKYARINNQKEEVVITETGVAHFAPDIQDNAKCVFVQCLRGTPRPQVFPFGAANPKALNYVGAIMSEKNEKWLDDGKSFSRNFPQGQRVYGTDGIGATLASQAGGLGAKTGLYAIDTRQIRDGVRVYENFVPTISARDWKGGNQVMKDMKIRRLTPTECERLQGFPDGWTDGVSDTQKYKCLRNAVTVNVVAEIAKKLIKSKTK